MDIKRLKQILIDQKEELEDSLIGQKIIEREFMDEYKKYLNSSLIKIITGPRRVGKSVLGYKLLADKNFAYVNFDDERISFLKTEELDLILQAIYELYQKPNFIFFDEIQNVSHWELFVNRLKRGGLNLVITGSNARMLSKELATHITGRHFVLELYPFSFREYLDFHNINYGKENLTTKEIALLKKFLENYLSEGGFPEVSQGENYRKYLNSLYSAILTRDIVSRHQIKYINTLKEIASYLISNFARRITFNKLKNIFSLKSVHTIQNYFSFLEETYLIFQVERFSYKAKERLTSPRKVYTIDTGLINTISTKFSQESGYIYENAIAIELRKRRFLNPQEEIYYWENLHHWEVDFVVKDRLKIKQIIQVCYNIEDYDTQKRETDSLLKASENLKCDNLLVITADYGGEERIKNKKIRFIPLWQWLLL